MKHNLKISVSKEPKSGGIVACRNVSFREKLLTRILGGKERMMVIVPGNSVAAVSITELAEGGDTDEQSQTPS